MADYMFEEMIDESLIDNKEILTFIHTYKDAYLNHKKIITASYFIHYPDSRISSLAVSLLNFPYEESERWRKEFSQATGYQPQLFEKSYEDFMQIVSPENEERLMTYLKIDEDKTLLEVESAINYLKLRKVQRMIIENQKDLENPHTHEEKELIKMAEKTLINMENELIQVHSHIKKMEMELTQKLGTVLIR
jgi:DNA primase